MLSYTLCRGYILSCHFFQPTIFWGKMQNIRPCNYIRPWRWILWRSVHACMCVIGVEISGIIGIIICILSSRESNSYSSGITIYTFKSLKNPSDNKKELARDLVWHSLVGCFSFDCVYFCLCGQLAFFHSERYFVTPGVW